MSSRVAADFAEHQNDPVWVHFSQLPQVTINPKQQHQDPSAIYLFPENFAASRLWRTFKYKFTVKLQGVTNVLDLSKLTSLEALRLLTELKVPPRYPADAGLTKETPDEKAPDLFWEIQRNFFILGEKKSPGKWNAALRAIGYDAVFDDTGTIHSAEDQLLVLDPGKIKIVSMELQSDSGFEDTVKAVEQIAAEGARYGSVEVTPPKRVKELYTKETKVEGTVEIRDGDNSAVWTVSPYRYSDEAYPSSLSIKLRNSKPNLNSIMSRGSTFQRLKLDVELKEFIREEFSKAMKDIFGEPKRALSDLLLHGDIPPLWDTQPMDNPTLEIRVGQNEQPAAPIYTQLDKLLVQGDANDSADSNDVIFPKQHDQDEPPYFGEHPMDDPDMPAAMAGNDFDPDVPVSVSHPPMLAGIAVEPLIQKYIDFFAAHGHPEIPFPKLKYRNDTMPKALGVTTYRASEPDNSTITIQKRIMDDPKTLERIVAHEMIHHLDNMVHKPTQKDIDSRNSLKRRGNASGGHGEFFQKWANEINQVEGKDFVTEKSDETYVLKPVDKDIYVLISKLPDGRYSADHSLRISPTQRALIEKRQENSGAKLIVTRDPIFLEAGKIRRGSQSIFREAELQKKVKELYETGQPVEASLLEQNQSFTTASQSDTTEAPWSRTNKPLNWKSTSKSPTQICANSSLEPLPQQNKPIETPSRLWNPNEKNLSLAGGKKSSTGKSNRYEVILLDEQRLITILNHLFQPIYKESKFSQDIKAIWDLYIEWLKNPLFDSRVKFISGDNSMIRLAVEGDTRFRLGLAGLFDDPILYVDTIALTDQHDYDDLKQKLQTSIEAKEFRDEGIVDGNWGTEASGIMFFHDKKVLLMKRASWTMDPGTWGIPGGAVPVDKDGDPMDAKTSALKETEEEIGGLPDCHSTNQSTVFKKGKFQYITYLYESDDEFSPILNREHTDAKWFPLDQLPSPLHPGVKWSLDQLFMKTIDTSLKSYADEFLAQFKDLTLKGFDFEGKKKIVILVDKAGKETKLSAKDSAEYLRLQKVGAKKTQSDTRLGDIPVYPIPGLQSDPRSWSGGEGQKTNPELDNEEFALDTAAGVAEAKGKPKAQGTTLKLYRGTNDVIPSHIDCLYHGQGIFGEGTYYGLEWDTARTYTDMADCLSIIGEYSVRFKKLLRLTSDDVGRLDVAGATGEILLKESGLEKFGMEPSPTGVGLASDKLGEEASQGGFDGVELKAGENGIGVDGGPQVLIPMQASPEIELDRFWIKLLDVALVKALSKQCKPVGKKANWLEYSAKDLKPVDAFLSKYKDAFDETGMDN